MSRASSLSFKIFITVTSLGLALVLLYYLSFLSKLFYLPYVFSPHEGSNLWVTLSILQDKFSPSNFTKLTQLNDYKESLLYPGLLISALKLSGSNSRGPMLLILELGRVMSICGLLISAVSTLFVLQKEKIDRFLSLAVVLLFMAIPLTQSLAHQARPELLAFGLGLTGICLFYRFASGANWLQSALTAFCLALPYALTGQLTFLSFALVPWASILVTKNTSLLKSFGLLTIVFISVSFAVNLKILGSRPLGLWSVDVWLANFEFIYAWPLFFGTLCLLFVGQEFSLPLKHPAVNLFLLSLILNLFSSGIFVDAAGGWLITIFALLWIMAVGFNQAINKAKVAQFAYNFLSLMVILTTILLPLLEPIPVRTLSENVGIAKQTAQFIKENRGSERVNHKGVLSQDLGLVLKLREKLILSDANLLRSSGSARQKISEMITEQEFNQIILAQNPAPLWPRKIVNDIKRYYSPTRKILVLGENGLVYEPKDLSDSASRSKYGEGQNTNQNIYATFHKV